jgi:hypothetical protein
MHVNEIKPEILHNRPPPQLLSQEIKLSGTGCTMASSTMTSGEPHVELLSHYRYGGYGYNHLYPYFGHGFGHGFGFGYGYPYYRRRCYPCRRLGPYSGFY